MNGWLSACLSLWLKLQFTIILNSISMSPILSQEIHFIRHVQDVFETFKTLERRFCWGLFFLNVNVLCEFQRRLSDIHNVYFSCLERLYLKRGLLFRGKKMENFSLRFLFLFLFLLLLLLFLIQLWEVGLASYPPYGFKMCRIEKIF